MKFTINQINEIFAGLSALNGEQTVVEISEKEKKVIFKPYDFSGKTLWNLAKNIDIFETETKRYKGVVDKIIVRLTNGGREINAADKAAVDAFYKELEPLQTEEKELNGVLNIKLSELNLDKNKIAPSILKSLMLIIDEKA